MRNKKHSFHDSFRNFQTRQEFSGKIRKKYMLHTSTKVNWRGLTFLEKIVFQGVTTLKCMSWHLCKICYFSEQNLKLKMIITDRRNINVSLVIIKVKLPPNYDLYYTKFGQIRQNWNEKILEKYLNINTEVKSKIFTFFEIIEFQKKFHEMRLRVVTLKCISWHPYKICYLFEHN